MKDKYNICVVGSGSMAKKHCQVLANEPNANLISLVVSETNETGDAFKNEFGFDALYKDLETALKKNEIDIIYIVSPNEFHEKQTVLSLESGKNVFCEKPLAYTRSEFDKIKQSLQKSGRVLQIGMNCRYRTQFSTVKEKINSGLLGDLKYIKTTYIFNLMPSIKAGEKKWWFNYPEGIFPYLHTGAIHSLDILQWIGGEPKSISAIGNKGELKGGWEFDTITATVEFKNGTVGEFVCSASANRPPDFSLDAWGSMGSIINGKLYKNIDDKIEESKIEFKQEKIDLSLQFADLINSIENNISPLNSIDEAYKNLELITAIEQSVKTKKTVNL